MRRARVRGSGKVGVEMFGRQPPPIETLCSRICHWTCKVEKQIDPRIREAFDERDEGDRERWDLMLEALRPGLPELVAGIRELHARIAADITTDSRRQR
jgi:hypothetical protein